MRCVIQRVRSASVTVGGETISEIGQGMLILGAIERGDTEQSVEAGARKIRELRIFGDEQGKMNRSLRDVGGSILAVSQFTLAGSIARGRRPSFDRAEEPDRARALFDHFTAVLGEEGVEVKTGAFREMMMVALENDGPVTFVYDG